jgi:hypothetical protein
MTLTEFLRLFDTLEACQPPYKANEPTWTPVARVEGLLGLSVSGLAKIRKRLGNRFEHRDARGRVFVFFPLWIRAYMHYRVEVDG